MNEWQLQKALRRTWLAVGAVIDDEPHLMAAWEVMTNWEVNDARRRWDLPSADFLLLDRHGNLVVLELKTRIRSPGESLLALCQVTHSAVALAETFTADKLASVSAACRRGEDDDPESDSLDWLSQVHERFFSLSDPVPLVAREVRRVVASLSFGPGWPAMVNFFATTGRAELRAHLESNYRTEARRNRSMERYLELPDPLPGCSAGVSTMKI